MRLVRLYAPSIVLFLWAATWALGATGDGVMVMALVLLGAACVLHVEEQRRRRSPVAPDAGRKVRRFLRENWYRDLWLVVITGLVLWALLDVQGVQDTLVDNQCKDLKVRIGQSQQFLDERAEAEPGLADYIRKTTLPDLHKRLRELPNHGDC